MIKKKPLVVFAIPLCCSLVCMYLYVVHLIVTDKPPYCGLKYTILLTDKSCVVNVSWAKVDTIHRNLCSCLSYMFIKV